jgi:hypothetical protein
MRTIALLARVIAGLVSFLYMAVLLPLVEFPAFDWGSTRSLWFVGMWAMSLAWFPLLIVHLFRKRMSERTVNIASVSLALLVGGFFVAMRVASYLRVGL